MFRKVLIVFFGILSIACSKSKKQSMPPWKAVAARLISTSAFRKDASGKTISRELTFTCHSSYKKNHGTFLITSLVSLKSRRLSLDLWGNHPDVFYTTEITLTVGPFKYRVTGIWNPDSNSVGIDVPPNFLRQVKFFKFGTINALSSEGKPVMWVFNLTNFIKSAKEAYLTCVY